MHLLCDGDIVAFRAAAAHSEYVTFDDDDNGTWSTDLDAAVARVDAVIERAIEVLQPEAFTMTLSHDVNFRKSFFPAYKANRKTSTRTPILADVKQHLADRWNAEIYPNLEADDVMGIIATDPDGIPNPVIWSLDKDLFTIPGAGMIRLGEIDEKPKIAYASREEAEWYWMYQTLIGDTVDNFKGCPGIGPVKAEKILEHCTTLEEMWQAVVETFTKRGFGPRLALQQARVARILHHGDYDLETGEVTLWNPPTS